MISIRVDPSKALGNLTDAQERQLPFAVSMAINRTANDAQSAERYRVKASFKLRREAFNLRGVYISKQDRANKTTWRAVIQIQADRDYLNKFEAGGEQMPHGRFRWIPNRDMFKSRIIGAGDPLHPKNHKFHKDPSGRMLGNERTFMVKTKGNGQVLVLQREDKRLTKRSSRLSSFTLDNVAVGMGPRTRKQKALSRTAGVRMLYRLTTRYKVRAQLEFYDTVSRTVQDVWPARMREALAEAMRGAK